MKNEQGIFGFFVSSTIGDNQGDQFRNYIWSKNQKHYKLQNLKSEKYGNDIIFILFQFYVNPIPYLINNLKEIDNYRKKEKSIGLPFIIDKINFFEKNEEQRQKYILETILKKIDLISDIVKKKKLDTKIDILKEDVYKIFH
jgi:hypothetical protein